MPTLELPQGRIHYRVAGPDASAAPPVVFVHGFLVNGELWSGVAAALAEAGIRSYAPDLPLGSHPYPLDPAADLSPRGVAGLIDDILAALELTDVTLVGNDTGGALCQFLLDAHPERIGRLVLTNCDAFDKFPPAPFNVLFRAGRSTAMLRAAAALVRPTFLRHSALGYGTLVRGRLDAALTRRWTTPLREAGIRTDTAHFLRAVRPADLLDVSTRLGRFERPVRLVWGEADRFFKIGFAERLASIFPDAQLVKIAGGRTFLPLDEPGAVAEQIRSVAAARH